MYFHMVRQTTAAQVICKEAVTLALQAPAAAEETAAEGAPAAGTTPAVVPTTFAADETGTAPAAEQQQ